MLGMWAAAPATAIWWLLALAGLLAGFVSIPNCARMARFSLLPINKQAAKAARFYSPFHSSPYPAKPASNLCQIREQARLYSMSKTTSDMHDSKKGRHRAS